MFVGRATRGVARPTRRAQFIGHPRSGTTLLNAIIDAHPRAVCANEFDVLKHFNIHEQGDLASEILFRSQFDVALRNRTHTGYSYAIEHAFQGRCVDRRCMVLCADKVSARSFRSRFGRACGARALECTTIEPSEQAAFISKRISGEHRAENMRLLR